MKGTKLEEYERMMEYLQKKFADTEYIDFIYYWVARLRGVTYGWNPNTDGFMQQIRLCDGCGRMPEYVCLNCGKSYCINHESTDECQKKEVMREENENKR